MAKHVFTDSRWIAPLAIVVSLAAQSTAIRAEGRLERRSVGVAVSRGRNPRRS